MTMTGVAADTDDRQTASRCRRRNLPTGTGKEGGCWAAQQTLSASDGWLREKE